MRKKRAGKKRKRKTKEKGRRKTGKRRSRRETCGGDKRLFCEAVTEKCRARKKKEQEALQNKLVNGGYGEKKRGRVHSKNVVVMSLSGE